MMISPKSPTKSPSKQISTMTLNMGTTRDATPLEMKVVRGEAQGEYEIAGLEAQRQRRQERNERLSQISKRPPIE
jgi:hypothetical protein